MQSLSHISKEVPQYQITDAVNSQYATDINSVYRPLIESQKSLLLTEVAVTMQMTRTAKMTTLRKIIRKVINDYERNINVKRRMQGVEHK